MESSPLLGAWRLTRLPLFGAVLGDSLVLPVREQARVVLQLLGALFLRFQMIVQLARLVQQLSSLQGSGAASGTDGLSNLPL